MNEIAKNKIRVQQGVKRALKNNHYFKGLFQNKNAQWVRDGVWFNDLKLRKRNVWNEIYCVLNEVLEE